MNLTLEVENSIVFYISVNNIEECIKLVLEKGGKLIQNKTTLSPELSFALISDTEGNKLGISETKK